MDPSPHPVQPLISAFVIGGVAIALYAIVRNRVIRRRMLFTLVVTAALIALHFAADYGLIAAAGETHSVEKVLLALAVINSLVALVFNPWFADRVRDRAPAIVQDALVLGLFLLIGFLFYQQDAKLFATSAIAAAVLGFALQETLGNAFAGLAIQTEKPFRVGHWVTVAGYDGRVTEVTWRATKILTKDGNLVTLPNNVVAREAISNYSEPVRPTRLFVEVGATYGAAPNDVADAILAAIAQSPYPLKTPKPDVILQDFAGSAITYRARFWIDDWADDVPARDSVRRSIYYEFARRDIEIPWPIQIEYSRQETKEDPDHRRERYRAIISRVPVLGGLFDEGHRALAASAVERLYGDGQIIVHEGDAAASMFVICRGEVAITIGDGREVARTKAGGYFGEMSLLTGDPRTATVKAKGDCVVLEIGAEAFKAYVTSHPEVIEHLAAAAAERKRELDQSRAAAAAGVHETRVSLADRMRRFFGLI